MNVQPYLYFDGRTEAALGFYTKAIGAKTEMMMRFKDSPDTKTCTPDNKEKVMHVCFKVGDTGSSPPTACTRANRISTVSR